MIAGIFNVLTALASSSAVVGYRLVMYMTKCDELHQFTYTSFYPKNTHFRCSTVVSENVDSLVQ